MEQPYCLCDARAGLGECPVWMPEDDAVYWVDIKNALLFRTCWPSGETTTYFLPEALCSFAPRRHGGFIGAYERSLAICDETGAKITSLSAPEADLPDNRFNDGKAGPYGAFWFGSMDDKETAPTGSLYRLSPEGQWAHMDAVGAVTNGPTFSPDGHTLYLTDSTNRTIYAYDMAQDGAITNKKVFLVLDPEQGYPDGMTVDVRGHLWVASFGGACVFDVSPAGTVVDRITLPVSNVTSCTFGGPDMNHLFITTARHHLSPDQEAKQLEAGGLFVVATPYQGLPAALYEG